MNERPTNKNSALPSPNLRTPRRLRWFRSFSLKSFLVATTVFVAALSFFYQTTQRNRLAEQMLQQNGISYRYHRSYFNNPPIQIEATAWGRALFGDEHFVPVRGITIAPEKHDNDQFWRKFGSHYRGLKQVSIVDLHSKTNIAIRPSAIEALAKLSGITDLYIENCRLSAESLTRLAKLRSLKRLKIISPECEVNLKNLNGLTKIEVIVLSQCNIGLAEAEELREALRNTMIVVHN